MKKTDPFIDGNGDAAELDDTFFAKAILGRPARQPEQRKQRVNVTLDPDVADRLRARGDISAQVNEMMRKELGLAK